MNNAIIHVILSTLVSVVILIALFIFQTFVLVLINPEDNLNTVFEEHWYIYISGVAAWFWGNYQYWTTNESVWDALLKIYGEPFNNRTVLVQNNFYPSFFQIQGWDSTVLINANHDGLIINAINSNTIYIPWSDIKNIAIIIEKNKNKSSVITLNSPIIDVKTFKIEWNEILAINLPSTIKCIERAI